MSNLSVERRPAYRIAAMLKRYHRPVLKPKEYDLRFAERLLRDLEENCFQVRSPDGPR